MNQRPKKEVLKIRVPRDINSIKADEIFQKFLNNRAPLLDYMAQISENGYLHWEKARYRTAPEGYSSTEAWYMAREVRKLSSRPIPIRTEDDEAFTFYRLQNVEGFLRYIDMYTGGQFMMDGSNPQTSAGEKQKYLTRGIIEEAIASSQLEGATTTRRYAKRMIAEKIKPRNKDDWMILNNFKVMQALEEDYRGRDLSVEMLLEMQDTLTRNTIPDDEVGRFRVDEDNIVVEYRDKITHVPPSEKFVKQELVRLIEYANDTKFVHPVTKAIILHFWIGYLHPFTDGNGRLARSIFYWYMLKNDYWAIAYLPISLVIKRAPAQYGNAYIYTEQDNLDFTYFYDYNLRRIVQAIEEFKRYVDDQHRQHALIDKKLEDIMYTNDRQKSLIHHLVSLPRQFTTVTSHQSLQNVSRVTAAKDIKDLADHDLLIAKRAGKNIRYTASEKLLQLL